MVCMNDFLNYINNKLPGSNAVRCVNNLMFLLAGMDEEDWAAPITAQTLNIIVEKAMLTKIEHGDKSFILDDVKVLYEFYAQNDLDF